jgi:hypothetical protein
MGMKWKVFALGTRKIFNITFLSMTALRGGAKADHIFAEWSICFTPDTLTRFFSGAKF